MKFNVAGVIRSINTSPESEDIQSLVFDKTFTTHIFHPSDDCRMITMMNYIDIDRNFTWPLVDDVSSYVYLAIKDFNILSPILLSLRKGNINQIHSKSAKILQYMGAMSKDEIRFVTIRHIPNSGFSKWLIWSQRDKKI